MSPILWKCHVTLSNSHCWLAMHLVLTLGKLSEIARLEWERGGRVERGPPGTPAHLPVCARKSPRPSLETAESSSISRFNYQRLAGRSSDGPPSGGGTIRAHLLNVGRCINMSPDPRCAGLSANHTIVILIDIVDNCHLSLDYYCLPGHCVTLPTIWSALYLSTRPFDDCGHHKPSAILAIHWTGSCLTISGSWRQYRTNSVSWGQ